MLMCTWDGEDLSEAGRALRHGCVRVKVDGGTAGEEGLGLLQPGRLRWALAFIVGIKGTSG